jgi:multisubunit Na+/H+ antiporter MnhB subunit
MMGSRPVREPTELVIWSASALLGIVVGIGTAFTVWVQLHRAADQGLLDGAVVAIALGLALVAVAVDNLTTRLFIWAVSGGLILAFFAGSGLFASLAG